MNIINLEHISKIYGDKVIFDDVSCGIHAGDKLGIIGINGTGKTTLLKLIAGMEAADEGQVIRQKGVKFGYLPQNQEFPADTTVLDYVLAHQKQELWEMESVAKSILNHLGLMEHEALIARLSGGQKKRAALARVLMEDTEVLLLDEPTNHLDEELMLWLEDYLKSYKGIVLMVTHDRYFLDKVSNKILEISYGKLYVYEANYSRFLEMKAQREEMDMASERKRQSVLRMELEWAKRGCRARSTKQRARLERLEELKGRSTPNQSRNVELESMATRMGRKTVELHHISKSYGDKKLFEDFDYIVLKNQRLGFVGPNGCGKSTLIKIIAGLLAPDSGTVEIGDTVKIGYFAQEVPDMNQSTRVIDYVRNIAEYIPTKEGAISAAQMLERFLFTPDMQYAPVEKLSGGEKKRLYLLGILQAAPNCLLIDECNDLDIPTLTIFEDYLNSFPGIVITVSHDRYFLDNVADRIFAFEGEGRLRQYEGGYTDYLEARQREASDSTSGYPVKKNTPGNALTGLGKGAAEKQNSPKNWKQGSPAKLKFSYKEQREYETIDEKIAVLENELEELDALILKNATNSAKLGDLMEEKEQTEKNLEENMDRWVYLNELAERINGENQ